MALSAASTATTAGDVPDMPQEHAAAAEISEWQEVPPGGLLGRVWRLLRR